jgi:hypothetical protein
MTCLVDRPSKHLLARAALACEQHRNVTHGRP